jgi:hypothetical protein
MVGMLHVLHVLHVLLRWRLVMGCASMWLLVVQVI